MTSSFTPYLHVWPLITVVTAFGFRHWTTPDSVSLMDCSAGLNASPVCCPVCLPWLTVTGSFHSYEESTAATMPAGRQFPVALMPPLQGGSLTALSSFAIFIFSVSERATQKFLVKDGLIRCSGLSPSKCVHIKEVSLNHVKEGVFDWKPRVTQSLVWLKVAYSKISRKYCMTKKKPNILKWVVN